MRIDTEDVTQFIEAYKRAEATGTDPVTKFTVERLRTIITTVSRRRVPPGIAADGVTADAVVIAAKWVKRAQV